MPNSEKEFKSAIEELEARSAEIRKKIADLKKEDSAAERKQREQAEQLVGKWMIDAVAGDWKRFDFVEFRGQLPLIADAIPVDAPDEGRDAAAARLAAAKKLKAFKAGDKPKQAEAPAEDSSLF